MGFLSILDLDTLTCRYMQSAMPHTPTMGFTSVGANQSWTPAGGKLGHAACMPKPLNSPRACSWLNAGAEDHGTPDLRRQVCFRGTVA